MVEAPLATEAVQSSESRGTKLQEFICCRDHKALNFHHPLTPAHPAMKLLSYLRRHEYFPAGICYVKDLQMDEIVCISLPHLKFRCFTWIHLGEVNEELVEINPDTWKGPSYTQMHGYIFYHCKEHRVESVFRAHKQTMPRLSKEAQIRTDADFKVEKGKTLKRSREDDEKPPVNEGSDTSEE